MTQGPSYRLGMAATELEVGAGGEKWCKRGEVWHSTGCSGGLKLAVKTLVLGELTNTLGICGGLDEKIHGVLGLNSIVLCVEGQP